MSPREIARYRLLQQHVAASKLKTPREVVSALGAVQAQDFLGALWAIGLRLRDATESEVEKAVEDRTIVRTWPMRGTLHFVAASDVRWMLDLLAPRVVARAAGRMRQFGIDDAAIARSRETLVGALRGGKQLSRAEIYSILGSAGVKTGGQMGLQILWRLAHEGLLCLAARKGKQHTFALLDDWVPKGRRLGRDEGLAELAHRYFVGHGPATLRDFSWWSGLPVSDCKAGLQAVSARLSKEVAGDETYWMSSRLPELDGTSVAHLLPAFDEFLVGYADRSAALDSTGVRGAPTPFVMLGPAVVVEGRMVGTWKRTIKKGLVCVAVAPFSRLGGAERRALMGPAQRYGRFLGLPVEVR